MAKVIIMAGGTGGHVFPALALARLLRAQSHEVIWLGTRLGLEARVVLEYLSVAGLRGKGMASWLTAPLTLIRALWQALRVMLRHRPRLVVGLGGFVSGPGGVAAWLTRRPVLIHEQNAIAGFTNRCLAYLARETLEAFPHSFPLGTKVKTIGNPVRQDILAVAAPVERFAARSGAIRLLVIGGSQGALRLNAVVPFALARLKDILRFEVRHQAGERGLQLTQQNYSTTAVRAEVTAFVEDMAEAYAWADLVICRSGALTIAELAAVGVAAILVPFPAAVDDHQTHNAQYLVKEGAAVLLADREFTAEVLATQLQALCSGRGKLLAMAERARLLAQPKAAQAMADRCLHYLGRAA
jgi:UDP-N-acetylglucosamine--N-acetylmuramyl-(pentapeptide) pyrophosphoryl-undecaprenol N-acetylglucosamine transferase